METQISLNAACIRRHPPADALSFADEILGSGDTWAPSLISDRLDSEFHVDWKIEVGSWLLCARDLGFLSALEPRLQRARTRQGKHSTGGPNDKAHLVLNQELAPAMTIYYFSSVGWTYVAWEPPVEPGDVDVRMRTKNGLLVDVQVKSPDQPGMLSSHVRVDGEFDDRVLSAIDHAVEQLDGTPGPCRLAVVSPQRTWSIGANKLLRHLVGQVIDHSRTPSARTGVFRDASGVTGLADIHLIRGVDKVLYRCTVILNPWCDSSARLSANDFPRARVHCGSSPGSGWTPEAPSH